MALIDFHCHLDLYPDPAATARKVVEEGVYILSVTTTPSAFAGTSALAPAGGRIRTALGLHPELAASRRHELRLFHQLLPTTDYVGEVGLDGSPPHRDTLQTQAEVLHEILDACAAAGGRTISLHSRGAAEMLLDMLEFEPLAGTFILHWFSAKPAIIERATSLGCWFSVGSGMMASRSDATPSTRCRLIACCRRPMGHLGWWKGSRSPRAVAVRFIAISPPSRRCPPRRQSA